MASSPPRDEAPRTKPQITYGDLHRYLYARTSVRPIRVKDLKRKVIEYQQANTSGREKTSSKHSPTELHTDDHRVRPYDPKRIPKLSRALESFPEEVQLCISSLPGVVYGVCAKRHIPTGTWIGPYEGRKVKTVRTWLGKESSYMWEVFHGGKLSYYLDGSDEDSSSWMRFISCARNSTEQNLYAFQYCGSIYYRAFKQIPPGTELLVWYDEIYPQFMGIPLEFKDLGNMATDEINAKIPSCSKDDSIALSGIPPKPSPRSSIGRSISNIPTNQTSVFSEQEVVSINNDDAITILSCDEEETFSPLKRLRENSLDLIVDSETLPKRMQTINPFEDASIQYNCEGSQGNEFTDGNSSVTEMTTEGHREEDPGLGVFRCGQCDKVFAQKSVLQMHVCTRTPNKPFQCGFCGTAFANPNELRIHASAHCNEKPFKCGYCFRSFSGATTLNNHIRTHTGEKPFICEKCGKTFSQGSQLSKHLRLSNCYKHGEDLMSKIM